MNKYPERKYDTIQDIVIDADLPTRLRTNAQDVYDSLYEQLSHKSETDKIKDICMFSVNKMINYCINNVVDGNVN